MSITLRAEFFVDDEANTWHYRVPASGGGTATREDAQRECMDALEFVTGWKGKEHLTEDVQVGR